MRRKKWFKKAEQAGCLHAPHAHDYGMLLIEERGDIERGNRYLDKAAEDGPDAWQLKYFAPGVGNVQVGWLGEEELQEELLLTEYVQLDEEGLAEIRTVALELEASAYENSEDLYGQTPPLEQMDGSENQ